MVRAPGMALRRLVLLLGAFMTMFMECPCSAARCGCRAGSVPAVDDAILGRVRARDGLNSGGTAGLFAAS
jgi:hypothetical protein